MIGETLPKLIGLLLLPIMTKYLTPEEYGIFAYIDAIILFVFVFSIISLNTYLLREYFELDTIINRKKLLGNFFLFLISYNFILFFFLYFLLYSLFFYVNVKFEIMPILTLALLVNFFEIFNIFPQIIYRVQEKAIKYIYFTISKVFFQVLAILFFLINMDQGVFSKYYGLLLVGIVYAIISFFIVKENAIFSFNLKQLKEGLFFSFPLVFGALSFIALDISDRIILERYVSMRELGIYSIAYALGFSINVIIKGSYKAFEPLIFKNSRKEGFMDIFKSVKNEYFTLIFSIGLLVILFSKELVLLLVDSNFYEAHLLVPIIVLAAVAKGVYSLYAVLLIINKKTKTLSLIIIIGATVNIAINLLYIEDYGSSAAALSTFFAYLIMSLLVHINSFYYYKFSYLIEAKDYAIIGVGFIVVYLMYYYLNTNITFGTILVKSFIFLFALLLIANFYNISIRNIVLKK
jgi:O-antigen/teichoic acid export membrane protein